MVTLTYLDDPWTLLPRDLQLFLKRLRKEVKRPVRFFACGEYGDESGRPHYHVVLFGVSKVLHGHLLQRIWGHGFVHVGDLNPRSAAYACGYVCKAMTKWGDGRLQGRHPEFVRMSLRPGIGSCVIGSISRQLMGSGASRAVASVGDVPSEVRIAGKRYPLGRYLRSLLRCAIGWESPKMPSMAARQLALRKSLETLDDLELLRQKRVHSELKAKYINSVNRTVGGSREKI